MADDILSGLQALEWKANNGRHLKKCRLSCMHSKRPVRWVHIEYCTFLKAATLSLAAPMLDKNKLLMTCVVPPVQNPTISSYIGRLYRSDSVFHSKAVIYQTRCQQLMLEPYPSLCSACCI